jgi:30S ribosomal protein S31
MGRGDKKTKKGKISMGSYGVLRPKEKSKVAVSSAKPAKKAAPKKETAAPKAAKAKPAAKKAETKAK